MWKLCIFEKEYQKIIKFYKEIFISVKNRQMQENRRLFSFCVRDLLFVQIQREEKECIYL